MFVMMGIVETIVKLFAAIAWLEEVVILIV